MFHWNGISVSEMCQLTVFWQIFVTECFLQMFHESCKNVLEICQNWYLLIFMTDLWQFSESGNDHFLTHLLLLIHFWGISKSFLTELWQKFESDRFLTYIWHNSDSFLTDFCKWQFSDRYITHLWKFWDLHWWRVP